MIIYLLTKQYSDKSGFMICGATESKAIAQAFVSGGSMMPTPVIYVLNTEEPLLAEGHPGMIGAF